MKFNKIISVFAAIAMLSASLITASAAEVVSTERYTDEDFDFLYLSALPTRDDAKLRNPSVSFSVAAEPIASKIKLTQAANADLAASWGLADFYVVTATFSNLGILANGYNDAFERAYIGLETLAIIADSADIKFAGAKGTQIANATVKAGLDEKNPGLVKTLFNAAADNPYPYYDADNFVDAAIDQTGTVTFNYVVGIEKDSSLTIPANKLSASVGYATTGSKLDYIDFAATKDLVIGQAEKDPIEIVGNRYDLADGFAWDVQVNKYQPAKTYTATFTDVTTTKTKVNDFDFSQYVEAQENATFGFVALLKTTKTNVTLSVQ